MSQTLQLPTLTEYGKWIYSQPDRACINKNMTNMFNNISKTLLGSTNFLHQEVNLPHNDPLVYAQYTTSYYEVATMMSINLTGESKKCFRYFYLVPDSVPDMSQGCSLGPPASGGPINRSNRIQEGVQQGTKI